MVEGNGGGGDSNSQSTDYKSVAVPIVLSRLLLFNMISPLGYGFYRTIQRIIKVIATIIKILGGNIIYFVVTLCSFSNSFTLEYVLSCNP